MTGMGAASMLASTSWPRRANSRAALSETLTQASAVVFNRASSGQRAERLLGELGLDTELAGRIEHLIELRRIIYPEVRHSPPPSISAAEALGFEQCAQNSVRYQTSVLDRQQLQQLLQMTPHLYRASQEGKQAAQALDQLQLSIDVALRVLKAP